MVCGRWVQDGNLKIYNEVYEFYISPIHCEILWGENDKNVIFNYDSWIHSMPKRNEKVRAEMHKRKNTIIESYKQGLVIINPKYSSGNRRIGNSLGRGMGGCWRDR